MNRRVRAEEELKVKSAREKLVQEELEGKRRLELVLDEMPLAVLLADADGRVHFCNARTRTLLRAQPAGPSWLAELEFLRADGTPLPSEELPMTRALHGETVRGQEVELRRREGGWLPLVANAAPITAPGGGVAGAVATFDDFSGVRRGEEERRQAQRFRDLFLSALGHDLRNPLSVITAGTAALLRRALPPEEGKVVQRIAWSGERMSRMIDQLLDITQARLGEGIPLSPQRVELGEVARRTVERIEVSYPGREVALQARGDLGGVWDGARLGQALSYLVVNALEHGQSDRPVTVSLAGEDPEQVLVEVHNWGNPIPAELVPLIFDPFLRAAERRRMKSSGLGLGLYLALQIARGHGGNLSVQSAPAAGTRFLLVLPRNP
jgi:signal transduction histidine kinase